MTFLELKVFFKKKFDIERHADIAKKLDVTAQAVNNWKVRDKIPHRIYLQVIEEYNYSKINSNKDENGISQSQIIQGVELKSDTLSFKETELSLWELIILFKQNYFIIFTTDVTLTFFSILYVQFVAKPVYISKASIIAAKNQTSSNNFTGMVAQLGIQAPSMSQGKLIYPEIIKSRTLAKKVLQKNFKSIHYKKEKTLLEILTKTDKKSKKGLDTILIRGVDIFINSLDVKENLKTGIISLVIEASEPKLSSDIASALIQELDTHQKRFTKKQVKKKRLFIQERIKDVNIELIKIEEALKNFRIQNRKYVDSPSLLLEFERLMREAEVQKQLYITLKKEFEMAQIEEVEDSDILYIIDEPETPLYYSRPRKRFFVILTGLLGIGLGLIIALINNSIKQKDKH
jgi:uncharacterized protein involved in exopolysaccharide biosynthesis